MAKTTEKALTEDLEGIMMSFRYNHGADHVSVMNDLLDYIIGFLDPTGKPIDGWRHTKDENEEFHKMMLCYFDTMDKALSSRDWFDAWGDLIMSMRAKGGGFEQYFTPVGACEMMTRSLIREGEMTSTAFVDFGNRHVINDPSCGSSRNLLASHAAITKNAERAPYLVGEDIDILCCKISAVNLAVHGALGEVVCHNTLTEPDSVRSGYLINHWLYKDDRGIPDIVRETEPAQFLATQVWREKKKKEYVQGKLF